jgi:hypothetical protein
MSLLNDRKARKEKMSMIKGTYIKELGQGVHEIRMKIFLIILVVPFLIGCSSMHNLSSLKGLNWDDPYGGYYQSDPQLQELWRDSIQEHGHQEKIPEFIGRLFMG